jgi:hypothetical protein
VPSLQTCVEPPCVPSLHHAAGMNCKQGANDSARDRRQCIDLLGVRRIPGLSLEFFTGPAYKLVTKRDNWSVSEHNVDRISGVAGTPAPSRSQRIEGAASRASGRSGQAARTPTALPSRRRLGLSPTGGALGPPVSSRGALLLCSFAPLLLCARGVGITTMSASELRRLRHCGSNGNPSAIRYPIDFQELPATNQGERKFGIFVAPQ